MMSSLYCGLSIRSVSIGTSIVEAICSKCRMRFTRIVSDGPAEWGSRRFDAVERW